MNITDAFDSYLNAKVRVAEWELEFNKRFYGPLAEVVLGTAMQNARTSPEFDRDKLESNLSPGALQKLRGE